jgi:hypothetical protein
VSLKGIYDVIRPKIWHLSDHLYKDRRTVSLWSERLPRYPNQIRGTHCSPRLFTQQSGLDVNKAVWITGSRLFVPLCVCFYSRLQPSASVIPVTFLILRIGSVSRGSRLQFVNRRFLQFPALYPTDPCCLLLLRTLRCSRRFLQIPAPYPTDPCCPLRCSRRPLLPPWYSCYLQLLRTRLSRRSLLPHWDSCYLQLL